MTAALIALSLLGTNPDPVKATDAQSAAPAAGGPHSDERDIIVTARRPGDAQIPSESEFDEAAIAAQGADSVQDLLTRLAPFLGGGRDAPLLLINGRPAGFDRSILAYPAEALDRLAVLKPQAAAVYGAPVGRRVVNLVLKRKFSSLTVDAGINGATRGGQAGAVVSAARTAIAGDTRWNVQGRVARDGALLKSARALARPAGAFDRVGYVSSPDGGAIDPALSSAAGAAVTVAAIPGDAASRAPMLADFVATANTTHPTDPNAATTLLPTRRTISLTAGVSRPLGGFSLSLDLNASGSDITTLRGLPMAAIVLPAGSPWSPFAQDVLLTRPLDGTRPLRNVNTARTLGASLTLTGAPGGWQTSVALSYRHNESTTLLENGIDVARAQALLDSGDARFNPYGAWSDSLMQATHSAAHGDTLSARLNVQKTIVDLPAGPLGLSLIADASRADSETHQDAAAPSIALFSQGNAQMALALPLSRRGHGWLGDLSATAWIGGQAMTRSAAQARGGGGVTWAPARTVQLSAVYERAGTAPSFDQLYAPPVQTVTRLFDYRRQAVAEPVWITGGNPALQRGSRQTLSLSALVQPLGDQRLMLTSNYRRTLARGGAAGFPELSPAVEAAFPDRVTRAADGQLTAVDARPIAITRDADATLASGVALRLAGGRQRRANPLQVTVSLTDSWRLESALLIRPGLPVIDRLRGNGTSRHIVTVLLGAGKRGIGANVTSNWSSPTRIDASDGGETLRVRPPTVVNGSVFVDPDRLFPHWHGGALGQLTLTLAIDNLFDSYSHVTRADGTIPPGFGHDDVDPLGRTIRFTVRKRF